MECGMVGWSASRLAGWLAGCLAASVENRPTPIHSSSLSSYVRVSLFIYMRKTRVWKMRVCRKKKGRGVATCYTFSRGGATVERRWFPQRRNFSTRAPKWPSRGMGREILVFLSPFFFFWLRFAFFGRANVILIARLSALLCEFARHFFISFPREIADAEEGETSSRFLAPLACEFVRRNENSPHPSVPHLFVRWFHAACFIADGCF